MTTAVLLPNSAIADSTASHGEVDKEQSQSNNADFKILLPEDFGV